MISKVDVKFDYKFIIKMTDRHSLESLFDFKDLATKTIVTERQKFE